MFLSKMVTMSIRNSVRHDWQTTSWNVKYLAFKYGLTEQSVRSMVSGLKGPEKEKRSLSAYHRALGLKLIDKRIRSSLNSKSFADSIGMSHFRLSDLEKGYDDIKISEIIYAELTDDIALLDPALLENE